jgi:S1-C subfamily serine protease
MNIRDAAPAVKGARPIQPDREETMIKPRRLWPAALAAGIGLSAGCQPGRPVRDTAERSSTPVRAAPVLAPRMEGPAPRTADEETAIQVGRRAGPSVVSVRRDGVMGSGVIVRQDGVVLTNAHVVGDAPLVEVGLADGRRLAGRVLGRDPTVDVAVVRLDARDLPAAPLADSDRLEVGQTAIAIGNPLGLERTLTRGVVSAVNRSPRGFGLDGLIQTDAAISPGNSGGPLLDSQGAVIGINTAVIAAPGASGLGFAVPINLASNIAEQLLTEGRVRRAFLGIEFRDLDPDMARLFRLPVPEGIIVAALAQGTPAARAGLREGDIITRVDDTLITQGGDLRRLLRQRRPGDTIRITVLRPSGRTVLPVRLGEIEIR